MDENTKMLINKQFEMLGVDFRYEDIPENGEPVKVGKKEDYWYNIFKFTEEQESEWVEWAKKELEDYTEKDSIFTDINLRFGLGVKYKRKGELF